MLGNEIQFELFEKGNINITKDSDIGKEILRVLVGKKKVKVFL